MTFKPGEIAAALPAFLERKLIECEAGPPDPGLFTQSPDGARRIAPGRAA
jgi:hypothetical protein